MINRIWKRIESLFDTFIESLDIEGWLLESIANWQCFAAIVGVLVFNGWAIIHWFYMDSYPSKEALFGNVAFFIYWLYCEHFWYAVKRKQDNISKNKENE